MKRTADLMREMGFRDDASEGAKEAFLKHLIKAAHGVEVETPTEKRKRQTKEWLEASQKTTETPTKGEPEQLSFNFSNSSNNKKAI